LASTTFLAAESTDLEPRKSWIMDGPSVLTLAQGEAVRDLLAHRLLGDSSAAAKAEWNEIVEGEHPLWDGIGNSYKDTIRRFLVQFHTELLSNPEKQRFKFKNGSVGKILSSRQPLLNSR
jgi:hypothetical protein